jgi:signal transduction histidine kinase
LRKTRILKAESFRLAALFALLFLALTGALMVTILWIVDGAQGSALIAANEADLTTVQNGFRDEGLDEAVEVVRQRLGTPLAAPMRRHSLPPGAYMAIENSRREVLAGNLAAVDCQPGVFKLMLPPATGYHHRRSIVGRCADLSPGVTVFVGRDTAALEMTRERIMNAFAWIALGTCGFAGLVGLFLGWRFMARVDAITETCERVIAGRLNERIPLRDRGDEWDRLARAINEMLDRISALLENLRQVSSDVAHDLRTPLTRLRNRLEEARSRAGNMEDCSNAMARAIDDTDQVITLFGAVLRISQVESGSRIQAFAPVCLTDLLEKIYELYLPVAEDFRHPLSRRLQAGVSMQGDEELLTQMFSNLVENAIRHTPGGTHLRLELASVDGFAVAHVIDDGPGVPCEERDKVLRRYYRLSTSRSTEGHGLGLSLVAAIAQLHGAKVELLDGNPGLQVRVAFSQGPGGRLTDL